MKVIIKSWVAVATWRWDLPEDDDCGICQAKYDATCPECKFPGDGCPPGLLHPSYCLNTNTILTFAKCPAFASTIFTQYVLRSGAALFENPNALVSSIVSANGSTKNHP